ncbi:iron transporter [Verticiella sediminum]|uniref:iron transporter n=1 Tax=Verticiella sediminum TaxID=1247510 RepID=UPI001B87316E|nr:iron transporter [Verticiella sediminum]
MSMPGGASDAPHTPDIRAAKRGRPAAAVRRGPGWRYRVDVLLRSLAAGGVGYLFASDVAGAAALGLALAGATSRAEAVMAGTMLGFIAWAVLAMWVFAQARTRRALAGACLAALLAWLASHGLAQMHANEIPAPAGAARGAR